MIQAGPGANRSCLNQTCGILATANPLGFHPPCVWGEDMIIADFTPPTCNTEAQLA
jgi:hypothetical protein